MDPLGAVWEVPEPRILPLEIGFLMRKSEKKDHSFLGSKGIIFKFTYSESLHKMKNPPRAKDYFGGSNKKTRNEKK